MATSTATRKRAQRAEDLDETTEEVEDIDLDDLDDEDDPDSDDDDEDFFDDDEDDPDEEDDDEEDPDSDDDEDEEDDAGEDPDDDEGPAPELRDYYLDVNLEEDGDGTKRHPFNSLPQGDPPGARSHPLHPLAHRRRGAPARRQRHPGGPDHPGPLRARPRAALRHPR
mgnify:CR=1 FL=1